MPAELAAGGDTEAMQLLNHAREDQLYPLIAENARTATGYGTCRACGRQVIRGERIADLVTGEGFAHVTCIAAMSGRHATITP